MSEKIVQFNEEVIKGQIKELVRGSVEETLNGLLESEAEKLTQAAKCERSEERQGYRSGLEGSICPRISNIAWMSCVFCREPLSQRCNGWHTFLKNC